MTQAHLLTYIRHAHDRGETDEKIVDTLVNAGYTKAEVEQALHQARTLSGRVGIHWSSWFLVCSLVLTIGLLIGAFWTSSFQEPTIVTVVPTPKALPTLTPAPPSVTPHPTAFITYCCEYRTYCPTSPHTLASVYVRNHPAFAGGPHLGMCQYTGYANSVDTLYYRDFGCRQEWQAKTACSLPPRTFCCRQPQVFCTDLDTYIPYKKYVALDKTIPPEYLSDRCQEIYDTTIHGPGIYQDAACTTVLENLSTCEHIIRTREGR